MFDASSRGGQRVNPDGSRNIYCYQCNDFICKSLPMQGISKALCELCRRILAGEPLTEEMIRAYKTDKADKVDVSLLVLEDENPKALGIQKFSLSNMAGTLLKALAPKAAPSKPLKSVRVAQESRRKRLFSEVDLGSMEDIDKNLKKDR